jgi:hypothetical protein
MKNLDYGIAYAETLEVLQYIPIEAYNKIPKTFIVMRIVSLLITLLFHLKSKNYQMIQKIF